MLGSVASAAVDPLDFEGSWPYPWSRLEQLALEVGTEPDELRDYLEREVAKRQAEMLSPEGSSEP